MDAVFLAAEDERAVGEALIVNGGSTSWDNFLGACACMAGKDSIPSVPLCAVKVWLRCRNLLAALRGETTRVPPHVLAFLPCPARRSAGRRRLKKISVIGRA